MRARWKAADDLARDSAARATGRAGPQIGLSCHRGGCSRSCRGGAAVIGVHVGLFRSSPRLILIRINGYTLFSWSICQQSRRLSPSSQSSLSRLQRRPGVCQQRTLRALAAAATTTPPTSGRAATARVPPGGGGGGMRRTSAHVPPRPPLAQPAEWRGPHQRGRWCGGGDPPSTSFALCVPRLPARKLRELSAAAVARPLTGGRLLTACVPVWRGGGMRRSLGRARPRVPPAPTAQWLGAHDDAFVGGRDGTCVCALRPAATRAQCERWRPQRSRDRQPPDDNRPRVCARGERGWGCGGPLAACAHRPRGQLGGAAWTAMW